MKQMLYHGRQLWRPFQEFDWSKAGRAYAWFVCALVALFLAPALTNVVDPPVVSSWRVAYSVSQARSSYVLTARHQESKVEAECKAVSASNLEFECQYEGPWGGDLSLRTSQLAAPQVTMVGGGTSTPDIRLGSHLPPLWLSALQILALALWLGHQGEALSSFKPTVRWLPWIALPLGCAVLLEAILRPADTEFYSMLREQLAAQPVMTGVAVVVAAPFVEELFFRGAGWNVLRRAFGNRLTIVLTALPFAALHGGQYDVPTLLVALAVGLALGVVRYRTGSVAPCILAHALNNGAALLSLV